MKLGPRIRPSGERAAALIIVLAFIVLATGLAVAYLTRTLTDRQVAQSSFNQAKADQLALSATDQIITDLKQEIVAGSTPSPVNGVTIYTPSPTPNMLPMRSGTPSPTPTPGSSDPSFPVNLIRRSVRDNGPNGTNPMPSPGIPSRASAVNSTSNVSLNGRSISLARWNKHYLLPRYNTGTNIDSTPPSPLPTPPLGPNPNPPVANGFMPPDWVFVTSAGPTPSPAPAAVIGRYAYAIYDEGGLLDLNEAGYPADPTSGGPKGLTPAQIGPKGALALADLTQLPTLGFGTLSQGQVNNLVGWRNPATAQLSGSNGSYNNYTFDATTATNWLTNFVNNNSTGFLKVSTMTVGAPPRTDQALLNRQQLLALTLPGSSGSLGFSQNVLKYLGTFSRELNAPSWGPTQNATDLGAANNGTNNVYAYKDNRDSTAAVNRFFPNVRMPSSTTITSYKSDGTSYTYAINAGQPLVQKRFLLSRINWLGRNGPQNGGTTANIQACFGLLWDSATFSWKYVGPTGSTTLSAIATLNTVAGASREANFFELLKAGILSGSLGLQPGAAVDFYTVDNTYADVDGQVIQIGANIIDQADADSFPTRIQFGTRKSGATVSPWNSVGAQAYYGSENIPTLYRLAFSPYRPKSSGGSITPDPAQNNFDAWLEPVFWTPAQGAVTAEPVSLRLRFVSGSGIVANVLNSTGSSKSTSPSLATATTRSLTFNRGTTLPSLSSGTQDPRLLRDLRASPNNMQVLADTGHAEDIYTDNGVTYVGFWLGQALGATKSVYNANVNLNWNSSSPSIFVMEANYGTTGTPSWQEIQRIAIRGNVSTPYNISGGSPWDTADVRAYCYTCADPRTGRFGLTLQIPSTFTALNNTAAIPPHPFYSTTAFYSYSAAEEFQDKYLPTGLRFNPPGNSSFQSGYRFYDNTSTTASDTSPFYTDPDGVQRAADGRWTSATNNTDPTLYDVTQKYRPIQLNRPFRSVGELSYALRDLPWKSLDFSTSKSADAGLLDLFCVNEQDPTSTMAAGKCSLNTRNSSVLQAILAGAFETENAATMSSTEAANVANALVTFTSSTTSPRGPLLNKSELVTRFAGSADLIGALTGPDDVIKTKKEVVIRALSEAGQTRTWNLLIDVIAQSGRYPPTATAAADLPTKFIVEGEQRYWVHVAIDRFTGVVIDRQIEVVKE